MTNERDIVDRLRTTSYVSIPLLEEASAEITRLRSELEAEREWKKAANAVIHSFVLFAVDVASSVEQLMDFQNGPPLPTYTEGWNDAMDRCGATAEWAQNLAKANANPLAAKAVEGARG